MMMMMKASEMAEARVRVERRTRRREGGRKNQQMSE